VIAMHPRCIGPVWCGGVARSDDIETARQQVLEAEAGWSRDTFDFQRYLTPLAIALLISTKIQASARTTESPRYGQRFPGPCPSGSKIFASKRCTCEASRRLRRRGRLGQ